MNYFTKGFLLLLAFRLTAGTPITNSSAAPIPPSLDSFYTPPHGFEKTSPGHILRHRAVTVTVNLPNYPPLAQSLQFLYRTTNTFGDAVAAMTTVLVPQNADLGKLVSFQDFEDSADIDCAPSFIIQTSQPEQTALLIELALMQGWVVAIPDHEGPKASYLANIQSAHAVLDGISAVLSSSSLTHLSKDPAIVLWGYSGGGLASAFAAELQPSYAPELKILGAAAGGIVPNITAVITEVNNKPNSWLIPAGIMGLVHEYPKLGPIIDAHLIPATASSFKATEHVCSEVLFGSENILSYFRDFNALMANPSLLAILAQNDMGNDSPEIPMFIYKGVQDEISPIGETDELVKKYCAGGSRVTYRRDILANHELDAVLALPAVLPCLNDRLNRVPVSHNCSTSTMVSSLFEIDAMSQETQNVILSALVDAIASSN
ncbi:hypothetical protein M441DRAFT_138247 [Trichoderma asperellum CBS 433.97]|uniref:Lipase n=1 Tax=Trichoderma asperellum (strain ATCC 204424 / CBS 433.97 / NBRC 101777) TaxID=1042311 RepID=A0A2T3ZAS5_TRIA4|nr:hypothetical protein M441DRAFT_138247 [Trichoderma asperellum CBS 433.97]PTB41913.1 hypothetical protein M441DRAFT_138247 [Trichoderma asperellum CBS 433.97]